LASLVVSLGGCFGFAIPLFPRVLLLIFNKALFIMAITILTGVPGEGKSLYGFNLIMDELIHGSRHIVTNLPIDIEKLNVAFFERFDNGCISDRVTMVEDHELKAIFTLDNRYPDEGRFFVLDEAHIAFNARQWQSTGEDVLFYLSQHRKLGDDVICITQAAGNLDKQFRSVAQHFVRCRNHITKRAGIFRGVAKFTANYFESETMRGETAQIVPYKIDWMADCYNTAQGVGIKGSNADKGAKRKGISIWWGAAAAVLFVAVISALPFLIGQFAGPALSGSSGDVSELEEVLPSLPVVSPSGSVSDSNSEDEGLPLHITGIIKGVKGLLVQLSDGRVLTHRDVSEVGSHSLIFEGDRLWLLSSSRGSISRCYPSPEVELSDSLFQIGEVSTNYPLSYSATFEALNLR